VSLHRIFPLLVGILGRGASSSVQVPYGIIFADQLPAPTEGRITAEDGSPIVPEQYRDTYLVAYRSDRLLTEADDELLTENYPRLLQQAGGRILAEDGLTVLNVG
jgi:hypothetical protein